MFVVQRPKPGIGNGPITLDLGEGALQNLYLAAPPPTSVAYTIRMLKGAALWEVGTGQLAVGGSLVRTTVTSNSSGTLVPIDFGSNPVEVTILRIVTAGGSIAPTVQLGTGTLSGTVPSGATRVRVCGTAAGGNGGTGGTGGFAGGGGGAGEHVSDLVIPVTAGQSWSISVGAVGSDTTLTINGVTWTLRRGANGSAGSAGAHGNGGNGGGAFGTFGQGAVGTTAATAGFTRPPFMGGNGGGGGGAGPVAEQSLTSNAGASGPYGVGGPSRILAGTGNAATGYGAGGGGGGTSSSAGGAGAQGFVMLEWA